MNTINQCPGPLANIYAGHRSAIERRHRDIQRWMQNAVTDPEIGSHLQFNSGVLQLWARFPVEIQNAAQTGDQVTLASPTSSSPTPS